MLDEQQEAAPAAEAQDDAIDAGETADAGGGGDDAIDIGEMGAGVDTADEPAVSADELMEIADAPERWEDSGEIAEPSPAATGAERAQHAAESAEAAAAKHAEAGGPPDANEMASTAEPPAAEPPDAEPPDEA